MTSPDTVPELRHGLERLVIDLFESDRRGVIQALEEDLRIPVLTANQVLLWHLLHLAGTRSPVAGYGRLFERDLPAQTAPPVVVADSATRQNE